MAVFVEDKPIEGVEPLRERMREEIKKLRQQLETQSAINQSLNEEAARLRAHNEFLKRENAELKEFLRSVRADILAIKEEYKHER